MGWNDYDAAREIAQRMDERDAADAGRQQEAITRDERDQRIADLDAQSDAYRWIHHR
jgi:hypothetical protein